MENLMKNLLITFVAISIAAGTAMADEKRKMDPVEIDHSARTTDCNNPTPFGAGLYVIAPGESFYFSYTGNGAGIDFTTCSDNTTFDTDVRVYDDCSDGVYNFYRDGLSACGWKTYMNCTDYTFVNGQNYLIVISGYGASDAGTFELIMNTPCPPPPAPPANDNMANATEVVVDGPCVSGSTLLATNDNLPPLYQHACYTGFYSATSTGSSVDTWHWFTSTGGCYTVSLCSGATWDTVLALYEADGTPIASDDDECGTRSSITSYAAGCWLPAGQILVAVDGYSAAKGDYTLCVTSCTASDTEDMPVAFELGKAFPNPFNPSTTINFTMGETALANLTVYNMNGQAVATLVDGMVSAGAQSVVFDASELTSGVYFYTLNVAGQTLTEKMVLVK
jgi:hypothetical protein